MKQILFDLDGTLTDSGEGVMHCFELSLTQLGSPIPPRSVLGQCIGPPLRASYHRFGIPPERMEEAIECFRNHYDAVGQFENVPYPGIADALKALKEAGHKLYVATSKHEYMSYAVLERFGLAQYFDIICGATSDSSRTTKEAVIAHLLTLLPSRDALVMVGDTIYDVEGAAIHGIPTVGVAWGYGDPAQMEKACIAVVHTMDELVSVLNA